MNSIKMTRPENNSESHSIAKEFFGIPVLDKKGNLLNGRVKKILKTDKKAICRFVNGFIDGNTYDKDSNVLEQLPAIEYSNGGTEYWTKGFPEGYPAVIQNFGYYEEDWSHCRILETREEFELLGLE